MLEIKVVGSGCPSCQKLEQLCRQIISELKIDAQIEKVNDLNEITGLGIFVTPGLVINNKVMSSGKLPTQSTLRRWLAKAAGIEA